jgi:hypothetical protein
MRENARIHVAHEKITAKPARLGFLRIYMHIYNVVRFYGPSSPASCVAPPKACDMGENRGARAEL